MEAYNQRMLATICQSEGKQLIFLYKIMILVSKTYFIREKSIYIL